MISLLVPLILAFSLISCGGHISQQQVTHYSLPLASETVDVVYKSSMPVLILSPISVTPLLENKGIVYKTVQTEIIVAKHHLWAENLSTQLFHHLLTGLRQQQSRYWVARSYPELNSHVEGSLLVNFEQFNGSFQGNAMIAGEWILFDGEAKMIRSQPFHYSEALKTEGYDALVEALSIATDKLVVELSQALSTS